jgi:hypothetical protein
MPDPAEPNAEHTPPTPPAVTLKDAAIRLLNPIPLTILVMLIGVTLLIAANVIGWDSGRVLTQMSTHDFARGLITYLFAITTIGTAVVLVMAALMHEITDEAYKRGKEILALLLGVFGTIVGFYFGSEKHDTASLLAELAVSQPHVSASIVPGGESVRLMATVSGGTPPYRFGVGIDKASDLDLDRAVSPDGWIIVDFTVPQVTENKDVAITLAVSDSAARNASTRSIVRVIPARPPQPAPPPK